ncbi:MAG: hypothetical protein LBC77_07625 [Spirochaetaceae bacterium]|jgi:hypothetical protein|nr:hypothetical protein [Spirochaetaceae bacterium]
MKKNIVFMLAMALTFGIGLAGCDPGGPWDGAGNSSPLVGKWYETQAYANAGDDSKLVLTFNSNNTFTMVGSGSGTWSTRGTELSLTFEGEQVVIFNYSIEGTALTLTQDGEDPLAPVYKPAN